MRQTRWLMGMPITVDAVGVPDTAAIDEVFDWLAAVDCRFSTYREDSEIAAVNRGQLKQAQYSTEMREILALAERTRADTSGYFDIRRADDSLDPSGIVKGWAILKAARILDGRSLEDYYVDAGGDIQSAGRNGAGAPWTVGIRNPFCLDEIVKVLVPDGAGIATSGSYARGQHIYDPHARQRPIDELVSLTVIGPDVLEADRFATAAFAMRADGVHFIEQLPGFEAYAIDATGRATLTSGFEAYCRP